MTGSNGPGLPPVEVQRALIAAGRAWASAQRRAEALEREERAREKAEEREYLEAHEDDDDHDEHG